MLFLLVETSLEKSSIEQFDEKIACNSYVNIVYNSYGRKSTCR